MNVSDLVEQALEGPAVDAVALHQNAHQRIIEQFGERVLFERNSFQSLPSPGTSHGQCTRSGGVNTASPASKFAMMAASPLLA